MCIGFMAVDLMSMNLMRMVRRGAVTLFACVLQLCYSEVSCYSKIKMKLAHIFHQLFVVFIVYRQAVFRAFGAFGHLGGKNHAGGLAAFFTVGLGQQFEDLKNLRLGGCLIHRFDVIAIFPGRVDFPLDPFDNFSNDPNKQRGKLVATPSVGEHRIRN